MFTKRKGFLGRKAVEMLSLSGKVLNSGSTRKRYLFVLDTQNGEKLIASTEPSLIETLIEKDNTVELRVEGGTAQSNYEIDPENIVGVYSGEIGKPPTDNETEISGEIVRTYDWRYSGEVVFRSRYIFAVETDHGKRIFYTSGNNSRSDLLINIGKHVTIRLPKKADPKQICQEITLDNIVNIS